MHSSVLKIYISLLDFKTTFIHLIFFLGLSCRINTRKRHIYLGLSLSQTESQPRWLSGLRRSRVHSLMIARRSLGPEKLGLISRAGMVSICPLLWQRDVKLQQSKLSQTENKRDFWHIPICVMYIPCSDICNVVGSGRSGYLPPCTKTNNSTITFRTMMN